MFHFQLVLFSEIYNFSVEFCKGLVTSSCFSKGHPLLGRGSSFKNKKIKPTLERYSARLHPMRTVVIHFGTPGIGKVLQVLRRSSSAALQSRLPSLLQKGRIVGRGQSSVRAPSRFHSDFRTASPQPLGGATLSVRAHPIGIRCRCRCVHWCVPYFFCCGQVTDGASFSLPGSRNAAFFGRSVPRSSLTFLHTIGSSGRDYESRCIVIRPPGTPLASAGGFVDVGQIRNLSFYRSIFLHSLHSPRSSRDRYKYRHRHRKTPSHQTTQLGHI